MWTIYKLNKYNNTELKKDQYNIPCLFFCFYVNKIKWGV